jgi:hypothetical protein
MQPLLFPNSFPVSYQDFELEVVPEACRRFPHLLSQIQEEVLHIAATSREWDSPESLQHMRSHFKLGPLYDANGLVLIRKAGRLVGLAGTVNDWETGAGSIVHLCSVGLLPEAQRRGFLPVLLAFVHQLTLRNARFLHDYRNKRAFVTAITQSPYLYSLLHRLFELYPSPDRPCIPPQIKTIADAVVHRFDNHLELEETSLVMRNECRFFYKRTPYSFNRQLNAFCDRNLAYHNGDVFVLVGRIIPERISQYITSVAATYPEMFSQLTQALSAHDSLPLKELGQRAEGIVSHV